MSLGAGSIDGLGAFAPASRIAAYEQGSVFGSERPITSLIDGAFSFSSLHFSKISSVAAITVVALQSLQMKAHSFASWASYIGTRAAPMPKQA